ncbi:MAG: NERD domain-containing protein/DEAD/DEAH box helicase [Anaerolineae bacterium]|nr:NERD domain-containing protein/DEAD/DEAH box helicase [Anaerolineae bacterium]
MARMFPYPLRGDTESAAERRLYAAFEAQLPPEFTVFHSVRWLARDPQYGPEDREADFILVHPELGILVLEVKGGVIRYDGVTGEWFSNAYTIKDPIAQVRRAKHSLLDLLKGIPPWQTRWLTLGYAVAFPDVSVERDLLPELPAALVLDLAGVADVTAWVRCAMAYWHGHDRKAGEVGREGVEALIRLFSSSWTLTPLLHATLEVETEALLKLTEEQYYVLDVLRAQHRALISGCAGSGKTLLALEQARRLAQAGFRVLWVCFNRYLSESIRARPLPEGVEVSHFHRLVEDWIAEAGLRDELRALRVEYGTDHEALLRDGYPEMLLRAVEILGSRYDALIVDEGQDFYSDWLLALDALLDKRRAEVIYVFKDDNQNLFRPRFELPWELPVFPLTRNCRNTQQIHTTVARFYRGDPRPQSLSPPGRVPETLYYQDAAGLEQLLRKALHHFLSVERLATSDVVILSPRRWGDLKPYARYGNYTLMETLTPESGEVALLTVQSFKGLESPVVILAGLENDVWPDPVTVAYVGMSRARNHLVILARENLADNLKALLPTT